MWKLDATRPLLAPRPRSGSHVAESIAFDTLHVLYEQNFRAVRTFILGLKDQVEACGYLDTTNGLVLNSTRAMEFARGNYKAGAEKNELEKFLTICAR